MQKITIIGRLTKDAVERVSQSNSRYYTFSIAVNSREGTATKTTYYDVTVLNTSRYENMLPYFKKGSSLCVIGELNLSTNTGNDGRSYLNARVVADSIDFVSGSARNENGTVNETQQTTVEEPAPVVETTVPEPEMKVTKARKKTVIEAVPEVPSAPATTSDDEDGLPF